MTQAKTTNNTARKSAKQLKGGDGDSIAHLTFPAVQVADPPSNVEWLDAARRELVLIRLSSIMLAEDDAAMTTRLMAADAETIAGFVEYAEAGMHWHGVLTARAALHEKVAMRLAVVLERIAAARPEVTA